jgi:hypothetical protein
MSGRKSGRCWEFVGLSDCVGFSSVVMDVGFGSVDVGVVWSGAVDMIGIVTERCQNDAGGRVWAVTKMLFNLLVCASVYDG